MPKKITENTCVLFISQSGQTFPSLHATAKVAKIVQDKIWILTGCANSKMEKAFSDVTRSLNIDPRPRVFNNYSGTRPAEPTSVAIVATMHTLTRMLMHISIAAEAFNDSMDDDDVVRIPTVLTECCIDDLALMLSECVMTNVSDIVGCDASGAPITAKSNVKHSTKPLTTHQRLVRQGQRWGEHISEPWSVLVCVGAYIIASVGLGLPIFNVLAHAIIGIAKIAGADFHVEYLGFSPLHPELIAKQSIVWTMVGLVIQIIDAIWFVFLAKMFTWLFRWRGDRPLWARHGKRTLVIVDTSCVHQLVEIFVSKLFSQSYSFVGIDVHGASGLDHFVHRFTHRVVRGVLLAVGRPDGRLSCLSKIVDHRACRS